MTKQTEVMERFDAVLESNPPRLVVQARKDADGNEQYQWGVVGNIPVISLIGQIAYTQNDLLRNCWVLTCPQPALVIVWDAATREFETFISPDLDTIPLVGMLELVKGALVSSRLAQAMAAQRVQMATQTRILGPDGNPVRH